MPPFLRSRASQLLTGVLLAQAAFFYGTSRGELAPPNKPLATLPQQFDTWKLVQEGTLDQQTLDVLRADDVITRTYGRNQESIANLFVAFFRSQRAGQAPHSPKNCLPGNGWIQLESGFMNIPIPALNRSIEVNRYIVERGEHKSIVMYWYQSRDRVVASEYEAKIYVVADAIRYNRTDTSLVRVTVPVVGNKQDEAVQQAAHFVQSFFPVLQTYLPQ